MQRRKDTKVLFCDFEVFKHDWLVVIGDLEKRKFITIVNNSDELSTFYEQHKDYVWVGYNIKGYDQYILKGILCGYNPYDISHWIIDLHLDGWQFAKDLNYVSLNIYDIQFEKSKSLKYYEGSLGHSIVESEVDFSVDRKLTKEELEKTIEYCTNDVSEGIKVFMLKLDDFKAQCQLLSMFNIPLKNIKKTKVQLSAMILGATKVCNNTEKERRKADEFNIDFPNTLILNKYEYIKKWYENWDNRDYSKSLQTIVAAVPHQFGWGGLHGAIENYKGEGRYLMFDVASLYPSLIIEYDLLSRYAKIEHYKDIVKKRLEYKKAKNPLQACLKVVINGSYGSMKDASNPMYDPLQANRVCVYGQLLLLDLIEKVENYGLLLQSNTDGILIKVNSEEHENKIREECNKWEKRTRLKLECTEIKKVVQKDVNNYALIKEDGSLKTKGALTKKLNELNYELAILNKAVVDNLVYNISIEETINNCNCLRDFQMIKRGTGNFPTLLLDGVEVNLKTIRVFASLGNKDAWCGMLSKRHKTGRIAKVEGLPDCVQMLNDDIINARIPGWLDKQWYINEAHRRADMFLEKYK